MATQFCRKCKESHPGRACDYDDQGECAETLEAPPEPPSPPGPKKTASTPRPA